MLNDLQQPAKDWLADALQACGHNLDAGHDPSFTINLGGCEFEFRLNKLPGKFERVSVDLGHPQTPDPRRHPPMPHHHSLLLAFLCAVLWAICVLCRRRDPVDPAAHVSLGPDGAPSTRSAVPHAPAAHLISVCAYCHRVTKVNPNVVSSDGRPIEAIEPGDELRLSHGICPACEPVAHAELDRLLPLQPSNPSTL